MTTAVQRQPRPRPPWHRPVPHLSALAVGLALGSTALLSPAVVHAQTVEQRLAALEAKLACVKIQEHELIIDGCNLHIRNGSGQTVLDKADTRYQGFGNLIVGYNEKAGPSPEQRLGSHNVVIGVGHSYTSYRGLAVGYNHTISGPYASVSGGASNLATAYGASVSGGEGNAATQEGASVSGGQDNHADHTFASVSGGHSNIASGSYASVSGGIANLASAQGASVSGGYSNTANGDKASVSGGSHNTASGSSASVSGGWENTASGGNASVSGGGQRSAPGSEDWCAGDLFADE